jgi:hypothetical protein
MLYALNRPFDASGSVVVSRGMSLLEVAHQEAFIRMRTKRHARVCLLRSPHRGTTTSVVSTYPPFIYTASCQRKHRGKARGALADKAENAHM